MESLPKSTTLTWAEVLGKLLANGVSVTTLAALSAEELQSQYGLAATQAKALAAAATEAEEKRVSENMDAVDDEPAPTSAPEPKLFASTTTEPSPKPKVALTHSVEVKVSRMTAMERADLTRHILTRGTKSARRPPTE